MRRQRLALLLAPLFCGPLSCSDPAPELRQGIVSPHRSKLRWKRYRAVQSDLARALALPKDEVCKEAGGRICATSRKVLFTDWLMAQGLDPEQAKAQCAALQGQAQCQDGPYIDLQSPQGVHVLSLGGDDPFLSEHYEPLAGPMLLSPLSLDRMALSACGERAARDAAGQPVVFSRFDVKAREIRPDSQGLPDGITDLYRRLLSRDPTAQEIEALLQMTTGMQVMSGKDFAQLACYAIATTTEFLFQ